MTKPAIHYASSRDGTRIAMTCVGGGPALVVATLHVSDGIDAPGPAARPWHDLLAPHRRVVRFDARGCGLSDRPSGAPDLDGCVEDLAAVVDSVEPSRPVTLLGLSHGAAIAVHYAAQQPGRVAGLVLCGAGARGRLRRPHDQAAADETRTITEAMRTAFSEGMAYTPGFRHALLTQFFPEASAAQHEALAAGIFPRMDGDTAAAYSELGYRFDLTQAAPRLRCPALVLHARDDPLMPFEEGRLLASLIPGAHFVPLAARNHLPLEGDATWPQVAGEVRRFLGLGATPVTAGPAALTPRQAQVLALVGRGHTDKEVARALGLSPRTVEMHVAHALRALDCRSRAQAVQVALQGGLLDRALP